MKKLLSLSIFFFLSAATIAQTNDEASRKVDSLFASYNSQTPGAAVAIVKDGKVIFKKGYGMADLDHNIPISPQTVFNIASVSKQFTAFAIYLLENDGKLSFDDDIRKFIPEMPGYGTPIKIRHLLAHTSGLRDQAALLAMAGWRFADIATTEQILTLIARQKGLNFTPGTVFNYSNTGYTLLAEIVQRITGKSFVEYTNEQIFRPLGMINTQFCDNYESVVKNKAESYERINNVYYHKPLNVSNPGPSNLLTTVEDLAKWILNFEHPIVGNAKLIKAYNEPSYFDNGTRVVLRVIGEDTIFHAKGQNLSHYKGVSMITHGGHAAAFRTFMGRFPQQRLAIIALSNDEHNERLQARWQIADFYIKDHLKEEKVNASPAQAEAAKPAASFPDNLINFEGEYFNEELNTSYTFKTKDNKLIMSHLRLGNVKLNRVGENKFTGSGDQTFFFEMEFLQNDNAVVSGFSISNFGVKNLRFVKMK